MAFQKNIFVGNTVADASEVNENFTEIYTELERFPSANGNLADGGVTEDAIAAGAISVTKFADSALETSSEGLTGTDTAIPTSAAVQAKIQTEVVKYSMQYIYEEVFDGTAPNGSWADLDLYSNSSGYQTKIGLNRALVCLLAINDPTGSTADNYLFRPNGYADGLSGAFSYGGGISAGSCNDDNSVFVMLPTDTNGVVEWITSNATTSQVILVSAQLLI
jgi:hypothetical protein